MPTGAAGFWHYDDELYENLRLTTRLKYADENIMSDLRSHGPDNQGDQQSIPKLAINHVRLSNPNNARLIVLEPLRDDRRIECSIIELSWHDFKNFEALSYETDHQMGDDATIYVNGRETTVPGDLGDALTILAGTSILRRYIWVDALCINQNDVEELGNQIAMMAQTKQSDMASTCAETQQVYDEFDMPGWRRIIELKYTSLFRSA